MIMMIICLTFIQLQPKPHPRHLLSCCLLSFLYSVSPSSFSPGCAVYWRAWCGVTPFYKGVVLGGLGDGGELLARESELALAKSSPIAFAQRAPDKDPGRTQPGTHPLLPPQTLLRDREQVGQLGSPGTPQMHGEPGYNWAPHGWALL